MITLHHREVTEMRSNYEKYKDIMCDILSLGPIDVERAAYKESETWSSLTHLILIERLEKEFNCIFSREDIISFQSYYKGVDVLKKKGLID